MCLTEGEREGCCGRWAFTKCVPVGERVRAHAGCLACSWTREYVCVQSSVHSALSTVLASLQNEMTDEGWGLQMDRRLFSPSWQTLWGVSDILSSKCLKTKMDAGSGFELHGQIETTANKKSYFSV